MKNIIKAIFIISQIMLIVPLTSGYSQNSDKVKDYRSVVKLSPIQLGSSTFQLNFEQYFKDRKYSLLLSPALLLRENGNETLLGFKGNIQYRFYLNHLTKPKNRTWGMHNIGFYVGPYIEYLYAKEDYVGGYYDEATNEYISSVYTKEVKSIQGGAITGLQLDIFPRLVLDLFLGGGIKYADVNDSLKPLAEGEYYEDYSILEREYTGVLPKAGLQIGFNF